MILVISSCAIILLTVNSNDEPSSLKLVTSVSEDLKDSGTSDSTETSQVRKSKTTDKKESKKTTEYKRSTRRSTTIASSRKTTSTSSAAYVKFPLDINKATKDELMQIDGVGEVTAGKILSHRRKLRYYTNLLQLKDIDGIGDATYEKLRNYLYVSSDKYKEMEETEKFSSKKTTTKATKTKATKVKTTKMKTSKVTGRVQTVEVKSMKMVNINTAEKDELIECLLIDEEEALKIIELRGKIGGKFTDTLELLYELSENEYNRIKDYVTV